MICTLSGGVGTGKTITSVKLAIESAKKNTVLTNFSIKKLKNYIRLKKGDILIEKFNDKGKLDGYDINWDFWEAHKNGDVFLDEVHNLINSRSSMSTVNKKYSEWIAQIRKIWGQSGDQNYLNTLSRMSNELFHRYHQQVYARSNNIFLITQKPRKIDVNFKELCHVHIQCSKQVIGDKVLIFQDHYLGNDQLSGIEMMEMGLKPKRTYFVANPYFNRYDSYEIVRGEFL